jgi:urease accessory protein
MLTITQRLEHARAPDVRLVLPYDLRNRSRFRTKLPDGEEVGVKLPRGQILRGGELLEAADGRIVEIVAAPETVSVARSDDPRALARAAYHLGNRHVALQVDAGWLRYSHDHVLDDMVRGLGLSVTVDSAPFEPEAGAYHGEEHHRHSGEDHTH